MLSTFPQLSDRLHFVAFLGALLLMVSFPLDLYQQWIFLSATSAWGRALLAQIGQRIAKAHCALPCPVALLKETTLPRYAKECIACGGPNKDSRSSLLKKGTRRQRESHLLLNGPEGSKKPFQTRTVCVPIVFSVVILPETDRPLKRRLVEDRGWMMKANYIYFVWNTVEDGTEGSSKINVWTIESICNSR